MNKIIVTESKLYNIIGNTVRRVLAEAYKSDKIRQVMNRNGGAKNRYDQSEDPKFVDNRVTQDGMGDITDDDIVYMREYNNVKDAQHQAWMLNQEDGRNIHYTVYQAKNGNGIVVGIDKSKVQMGSIWGGEATKKHADRINNNGWNPKNGNSRYVDDSDTYYTTPSSPSKDFGYRTNHDFQNMRNYLSNSKQNSDDGSYNDWRDSSLRNMKDYVKRNYPKQAKRIR